MVPLSVKTVRSNPLDDVTYDLIALLHEKSKTLETYGQYIEDAGGDETLLKLFEKMRADEEDHIFQLRAQLSLRMGSVDGFVERAPRSEGGVTRSSR